MDTITLAKPCVFNGSVHIMIQDERTYVKILEDNDTKLKIVQDNFVENEFWGTSASMKKYSYNNGMVYDNEGAYMLTPRTEPKGLWDKLQIDNVYLEWQRSGFPLVTQDFVLFAMAPKYNTQQDKDISKVLIAPPMNSLMSRQLYKSAMIEFFFHEDNTYIIRAWPDVVREYGSHEDQLVWKIQVSRVNGKVLQDITIQEGTDIENFVPLASPDGKYIAFMGMCEAEEGDPLVQISVYEIVKGDIFETTSSSDSSRDSDHGESPDQEVAPDIIGLKKFQEQLILDDFFERAAMPTYRQRQYLDTLLHDDEETGKAFLDTKGNFYIISLTHQQAFIND